MLLASGIVQHHNSSGKLCFSSTRFEEAMGDNVDADAEADAVHAPIAHDNFNHFGLEF